MSALQQAVYDYLELRRNLGYKLEREGSLLPEFVDFVERSDGSSITVALALDWATEPTLTPPSWDC